MSHLLGLFALFCFAWGNGSVDLGGEEVISEHHGIGPDRFVNVLKPDSCEEFIEEREDLFEDESGESSNELEKTDQQKLNFFSNLYDGFSSGVSTVFLSANSAKKHFYSKISDVTSEFADKVRNIMKEEFWGLITDGLKDLFTSATAPGN